MKKTIDQPQKGREMFLKRGERERGERWNRADSAGQRNGGGA